ncbi:MAG: SusC/RagA family TonB-linked outer membrane protein [Gemmatimonadaceae bacterium]
MQMHDQRSFTNPSPRAGALRRWTRHSGVATMAFILSVVLATTAAAQRRVTGRVTESNGQPVPNVTVSVLNTTIGGITGEDGRFALNSVPQGQQTLVARRIGYRRATQLLPTGSDNVDIHLDPDLLQLETVVVTGQATTVSSQNAANAVTVVGSGEVNRVPQPNVENALQGKVPGAVITQNSGAPGGGVQLQIRGSNTVNGAFQPLYVVDGVIINNDAFTTGLNSITGAGGGIAGVQDQQVNRIADLNPEEIENIEILKGPSAGAIYGSRGANGVVVITTKRGQAGRASLNFIQRVGTQQLSNSYDMRCFSYDDAKTIALKVYKINLAPEDYAGCVDEQKILYDNHYMSYEDALSLRGGGQNTTYFASGSVKHDGGLAVNSGYTKQNLRLNLNQLLGSSFNISSSSEILHTITERGISGNDNNNIAPYTIIGATPTWFDPRRRDPVTGALISNPYIGGGANVLQDQQAIRTPEEVYRAIGNVQGNWSIINSERQTLNFNVLGGLDAFNDHARIYSPPTTYIEQSGNISPYPGTIVDGNSDVVNANLNASLIHKYVARFATATTSAGLRQERSQSTQAINQGRGLFPGVTNFATAVQTAVSDVQNLTKTFSFYGQEEVSLLSDRLFLTAAVNAERSSTNGDTAKFYAFPKFSASYNVPFTPTGVDNIKLRVATGKAGNRVPVNFKYNFLTQVPEDGIVGIRPSTTIGLTTVAPEVTNETEGGIDAQFLKGRAQAEFTLYSKKTSGLVLQAAPAPSTGFTTQIINGGSLTNKGAEIGLGIIPVQTRMLTWESHTTYARNRGMVTSLPVPAFYTGNGFGERTARTKVQVGYAPDEVVAFNGFDATGARIEQFYGSESPDFTMGFGNDFTVGPFRLSTLIDWRKGGWLADLSQTYLEQGSNGQSGIPGGNFADTSMNTADQTAYAAGHPAFLEHGSFAKLREVTLSYSLNPRLTNTLFRGTAKDVRFELSGRNLYTWTHYRGLDPEVSNFGNAALSRMWDLAPYPPSRQFFLSADVNF